MSILNSGRVGFGQTTEAIVINWKASGLLDGLDDLAKEKTALIMEEAAKILLNVRKYSNPSFDVMTFPVIRRIITLIEKEENNEALISLLTADYILQKFNKIYDIAYDFFEKLYCEEKNIDVEAVLACFISEEIVRQYLNTFKNKNIIKEDNKFLVVTKPII